MCEGRPEGHEVQVRASERIAYAQIEDNIFPSPGTAAKIHLVKNPVGSPGQPRFPQRNCKVHPQNKEADIEANANAGINGYLPEPITGEFSTGTLGIIFTQPDITGIHKQCSV